MSAPLTLGIDPGKRTGWGLVAEGRRVVGFGALRAGEEEAHLLELLRSELPHVVAVEMVARVHPVRRKGISGISTDQAMALIRGARVGERLLGAARREGRAVIEVSAETWRGALASDAQADDATIERALRLRLAGFPAPRKSNDHMRDGIGVALFGALRSRLKEVSRG